MVLMCVNNRVYDIDSEYVYNANLLPGLMRRCPCTTSFNAWIRTRYSSNSNAIARNLKGLTYGQGKRKIINRMTYSMSLSDSYWVKEMSSPLLFEEVSPYYSKFWDGRGDYDVNIGGAIPTLYVGGYLNKEWVSSKYLHKYGDLGIEVVVTELCKKCGIPVCNIESISNGVRIENFTSPGIMLEQADQSGMLNSEDFDESKIISLFGLSGLQMLTIDAIIGNGDRHAGNFGWLRSTKTGDYLSMAPLYDFDHALDVVSTKNDYFIQGLIGVCSRKEYIDEVSRIVRIVMHSNTNEVFKKRAMVIMYILNR